MFDHVLLPYDGSETARAILPVAQDLARRWQGRLVVHRCLEQSDGGLEAAERELEALAEALRAGGLEVATQVSRGRPDDAIVQAAEELGVTAIAMSTHGRTGLARWALGSVAERVVRTSQVPVLLARALAGGAEGEVGQPPQAPERVRHVLVPVDGTEMSLRYAEPLAELVDALGARVSLLHCVSDYRGKGAMEEGQRALDAAERAFAARGVEVATHLLRGHPAVVIADYGLLEASQERPDLIAMATHARQGVPRMLLGSVTEKVLRASVVPLLVLPPTTARATPGVSGQP